jgi:hypothetical protein
VLLIIQTNFVTHDDFLVKF